MFAFSVDQENQVLLKERWDRSFFLFGCGNATKWPWYKSESQILRYRTSPGNGLKLHLVGSVGSSFSLGNEFTKLLASNLKMTVIKLSFASRDHVNGISMPSKQINLPKNMVFQTCHTSRYVLPPSTCHISQLNRCNHQKCLHLKLAENVCLFVTPNEKLKDGNLANKGFF